jgi:hypothetical protein
MAGRKTTAPEEAENKQTEELANSPVTPAAAAEKPRTIRSICEEGLLASLPYEQIIANVKAVHPSASTSPGCVAWYRSKMVKKGLVPSGKEMAAARKRAAEAELVTQ